MKRQSLPSKQNFTALAAWALYDWGTGAYSVLIQTFVFATYFVDHVAANKETGAAVWGLTIGFIGFLTALGGPFIGSLADQGGRRKRWLAFCTALCAGSSLLTWFVYPEPSNVPLALTLVSIGTVGSEFAYVFYNAMLPELAAPDKIGRWSGWGWGMGYGGGTVSLIIALYAFIFTTDPWIRLDQSTYADIRATFILAGAWIITFSIPLFIFSPKDEFPAITFKQVFRLSIQELAVSLKNVWKFRHIALFFIARMFYTDGLTTLFTFGGIYAAAQFNFTETEILIFGISLNITAGIGAALFAILDDFWGSREIIITSLIALIILSSLALLTDDIWHFWAYGLSLGVFVGPVQASSRSYLARWAPPHLRNQMFGFFTLTGRATAFLGPTLIGWITLISGSLSVAMSVIVVFLAIGLGLALLLPDHPPAYGESL